MDTSKAAIIEFFLFISQNPLSISEIKEMVGNMESDEIKETINWLQEKFYCPGRALQITEVTGGYQICTRPEFHSWLERITHHQVRRRLTRAALEVLAIVAYKQPITKYEVDEIRGVDSGYLLRNLLKKKLICIVGKKESLGRPVLYGTGKEFLTYFGLKELGQLPRESELKELIADGEKEDRNDKAQ
jgi:segregation and condensation protein B